MELFEELIKFHSPGNRFVYYPATKNWEKNSSLPIASLIGEENSPVALYFHLPFCQQMCTFCGCNINLSKKREDHLDYIDALKKEWELKDEQYKFVSQLEGKDVFIILGGGTPTDLHPDAFLVFKKFLKDKIPSNVSFGLSEANPKTLSERFISEATDLNIQNFSFGVQDFSEDVCLNVNRHQTFGDLQNSFSLLGDHAQKGIDLIWGLPKQRSEKIAEIWKQPIEILSPDWISFYPLAEVPWMKTYQEAYGDFSLPSLEEKYRIYQEGVKLFESLGYIHTYFGHFVKEGSLINKWRQENSLYRTVSGLLPHKPNSLIGFGVGALSLGHFESHQNEKILDKYKALLRKDTLPLSSRYHPKESDEKFLNLRDELLIQGRLPDFKKEEILEEFPNDWFKDGFLTPKGRHFLKNILQTIEKNHFTT